MTSLDAPLHILVVDDDPDLCSLLSDYLGLHGFVVDTVGDGSGMRLALAQRVPDLIVMDLMLPGEDGLSLVRSLKARWRVPVLMLSARGEEMDRVIGLEVGADDYMPKPFGPRELLARVRALIRRTGGPSPAVDGSGIGASGAPASAGLAWVHFGSFALDAAGHRLMRDGTEVNLTTAEFELLVALATRPNRVLSRDTLVDLLKGYDRDPFDRSIDNRVTRLRRKIEANPTAPVYIRTVRGEGYLFNPQGARP